MNNLPKNGNSYQVPAGIAVILLSISGLDSKFDPETLGQLVELITIIISGFIGIFIVISNYYRAKGKNGTTKVDIRTEQATTPDVGQQTNTGLPDSVRTNPEWSK